MNSNVHSLEFTFICRVCLAKTELTPFSEQYSKLFLNITNIHVKPGDDLPQNICLNCAGKLEDISEFIEFSKLNDAKLRSTLNRKIESVFISEQGSIEIKEDIISIKDENEDFSMSQDEWVGEEEIAPKMDFEDSEECVPEYIDMKDIQESMNQSLGESEPPFCDLSSCSIPFQGITSEIVPTEKTEQIGNEASLELKKENGKNPFVPKKTLVVKLLRLKIVKLKAKSVNFRSTGNSNDFVTIRMGTKPQTNATVQSVNNSQELDPEFSESSVVRVDEDQFALNPQTNVDRIDPQNNFNVETVPVLSDGKKIDTWNHCLFCKKDVACFASHVLMHHPDEKEVVQILSFPLYSEERKLLMTFLRRKSNYLRNSEVCCISMRKTVRPCRRCLEVYKQLCDQIKKCSANPAVDKIVQVNALNFLFNYPHIDEDLTLRVFPRMRSDHVSMVAQTDILITDYGANYLKSHVAETHAVHVTSRKMRELARFLIELNKMNPSIKSLKESLQPQFYELLVKATRIIGKYDAALNTYECPTFVTSIGYMLKHCCEIAIAVARENKDFYGDVDADEAIFDFSMMIELFDTNWREEVLKPVRNQMLKVI